MLLLKVFHIFFMTAWFAGIFYLPRLFVYHAMPGLLPQEHARFCLMERKLFWGIMTPSAILTVIFGFALLSQPGFSFFWKAPWLHAKLGLVMLILVYHVMCGFYWVRFSQGRNTHSSLFYRFFNEVPVLFLFAIIYLVVMKP